MLRALTYSHDPALLRVLGRALRAMSIEPLSSSDLTDTRALMESGGFALVLVDTDNRDGEALLRKAVARCPDARHVQICASASAARVPGVDAFLVSPFTLPEVQAAVGSPAASSAVNEPPQALDREQLLDCVKGDLAELDQMVELFLGGAEKQIERARRAIDAGDHGETRQALHRLCGAAATAGADLLAALCRREMERMEHSESYLPPLARIEGALRAFREAYARWRGVPG